MTSIRNLHKRIEKLETVFLFKPEKLFYETLSDEDTAKLIRSMNDDELDKIRLADNDYDMNELFENCFNKYKDSMNDVFATEQELIDYIADIDFYVKYSLSLSKPDQLKLKDYNSKVSKRFEELITIRKKKRGVQNAGIQLRN